MIAQNLHCVFVLFGCEKDIRKLAMVLDGFFDCLEVCTLGVKVYCMCTEAN